MFDILLEVKIAILTAVIFYTILHGTRHPVIKNQPGINQIIIGFGLLLFSSLIDITDNFPTLNFVVLIGDTALQAFLEKAVGTTLGLLFISWGFRLWLPSIQELVNTRQLLNKLTIELDGRVQRRSIELEQSNDNLKIEVLERKKIEKRLKHQAFHDALTTLPNRSALIDFLEHEISNPENHDSVSALFFLDLDNFKHINDLLGHHVGDSVLKITAKRLNNLNPPPNTFIGRLGGDEFVLVMTNINTDLHVAKELVRTMAQQVIRTLDKPIYLSEHKLKASCSIGIKIFQNKKQGTVSDLLRQADIALYDIMERVHLAREIYDALEKKQFYLHYQPQVSNDGQVFGLEALLRWEHPTRGTIGPDEFIPIAEEAGLIDKLGRYVLHHALSECSSFLANEVRWQSGNGSHRVCTRWFL